MSTRIQKTVEGKQLNIEVFNSAYEVAEVNAKRERTDCRFHDMERYVRTKTRWFGVESYDEALELLRTGYQPVIEDLKQSFKMTRQGTAKRFRFENNVHGFAPVVPLALKGVPNSMANMTMKPIKAKVVDVFYDMTVNCGVSSRAQMKAGREVLAAIIEMERQGYRFNLYATISFTGWSNADIVCIKIKSAEQPLDLKRVSFPMAHTGFFRVIGFDWYGKVPGGTYRSGYGQGAYMRWGKDRSREIFEEAFGKKNIVYFSAQELCRNADKDVIMKEVDQG